MTESSKLPEEFEAVGIEDMLQGESAYTVPWSVWVKPDGTAEINGTFPFHEKPVGTSKMGIIRDTDHVKVDTKTIKGETFSKTDNPPHMGAKEEDYIPVRFVK